MKHKKYMLPVVLLGLVWTISTGVEAADNQETLQSQISEVTVYTNGAHIRREAGITLPKGETTLVLSDLSPYINEQSVRVKGKGNIVILSVSSQKNYTDNLKESDRLTSLRKQLEEIQVEIGNQEMMIGLLKDKESFLEANKVIGGKDQSLEAANFKTLYEYYSANMEKVLAGILEKNRAVTRLKEQEKEITREINQLQSAGKLPAGLITITVKASAPGEARFEIGYMVSNAGWFPSYDIRVDNPGEPVGLVYKANVYQQTGVEWKNVRLTFSNATPSRPGNVPVLFPWYIDFRQVSSAERIQPYARSAKKAASELYENEAAMDKLAPAELPEALTVNTSKTVRTTSVEFSIDVPYTIASAAKPKSIDMMHVSLPASYQYQAVPRIENAAFLVAGIHDWEKYDLLPGEAGIYFENTYVGKTSLNLQNVNDTLDISLGRDQGIVIKREKQEDLTSDRFLGGNRIETRSWKISARNTKKQPVDITIEDQIPVSKNKDIMVEPTGLSGGELNETTGIIRWNLTIKPGETREVTFGYSVKYPKDRQINL